MSYFGDYEMLQKQIFQTAMRTQLIVEWIQELWQAQCC
jgi:hypothetical protein